MPALKHNGRHGAGRYGWLLGLVVACGAPKVAERPSILLVTLDTTRADSVQPESSEVETPAFAALAARGRRYSQAYATAPMTLPSHASMMTGLYPAGHGVHENGRRLAPSPPLLAEELRQREYATAAFVSGYPLERPFGLARGFEHFDDDFGAGRVERSAAATTDRALARLASLPAGKPAFVWVHYYDAHEPYAPPEPFRSRYAADPYLGEIAAVDRELGRLSAAFAARYATNHRLLVAGDHGEGRGDHGEQQHGNLLYQGVMRVPLIIAGTGIEAAVIRVPVSLRQIHDTVLHWAGLTESKGLLAPKPEPVLAEGMKPFLNDGWQPQVMGVLGPLKVIRSGVTEVYDVLADPAEQRNLEGTTAPPRELLSAIRAYPLPARGGVAGAPLNDEQRRQLASLGYVAAESPAPVRADAPNPKDMTHLFADLDLASGLFVAERYREAIPVFERLLAADPGSFMVTLRLAAAHSVLGHEREAERLFERAAAIDPGSLDLTHYRALYLLRTGRLDAALPLFERVLAATPDRLAALEGVGEIRMARGETGAAIAAYERASALAGEHFAHPLELGVLYLADGRYADAAAMLDHVPAGHPGYAMALFKRAQAAVLLHEPDASARIATARAAADATTRGLIERERLFRNLP